MMFLKTLPLKLWTYVGMFFAALGFIGYVYKAGGDKTDLKNVKETLSAVKRRKEIEDRVGAISNDDVLVQLRKNGWIR